MSVFTTSYTFTPNITTYPGWAIGSLSINSGYWKDYTVGGLSQLWWKP